jgi:hypothetical protein
MAEETPRSQTTPPATSETSSGSGSRTPSRSVQPTTPPPSISSSSKNCEVGKNCDRPVKYKATSDSFVVYSCEVHCSDIDSTFPGMTFVVEVV